MAFNNIKRLLFAFYCCVSYEKRINCFKLFQFWLIIAISTGILFYQSSKCVQKYFANETGTVDTYVDVTATSFPELTICPSKSYKENIVLKNGIANLTDIQFNSHWISNDSEKSAQQFYEEIVFSPGEVIQEINIFTRNSVNESRYIKANINDTLCSQALYSIKPYYYFGNCFTIQIPGCLFAAGILEIWIIVLQKVDIFIYHQGQFLNQNSR